MAFIGVTNGHGPSPQPAAEDLQKQSFHRNLFMRDNFTKAKYFSKFECFQERKRIEDINKQEKEMLETTKQ